MEYLCLMGLKCPHIGKEISRGSLMKRTPRSRKSKSVKKSKRHDTHGR